MSKHKNKRRWSAQDIPCQADRLAIVTGANSGLGFHTTKALANNGARIIMACRNLEKGEKARQKILEMNPAHAPEVWHLDLASLKSVEEFSLKFISSFKGLDLLINNAGLMAIPYGKTRDGFEMQFGVNYLGHFALTSHMWPLLTDTAHSRVVNVSSLAHRIGNIRFEDPHWEKDYSKWGAYGMSKLSNLLFTIELASRLKASAFDIIAAAAHPGYADTELQAKGAKMKGSRLGADSFNLINRMVAQSAEKGALPSLYAATADDVKQGGYYGPDGFMRLKGWPSPDNPSKKRVDKQVAVRLWELSEQLTGRNIPI
jgi:NAD(P)-dependent dehydrogenase (short-subunit alcohol dehydrogenase family)